MTRAIRLTYLSLLLVGLTASVALAKPSIAILGLEVYDKSGGTPTPNDTGVAQELTSALRGRAKAGTGPYQLAPGSDKELIDEKLLKNCDDEGKNCMSAIGHDLNADMLMYGKIEKQGSSYNVTMVLLDVARKQRAQTVTSFVIPLNETSGPSLLGFAKQLYAKLTGQSESCTIAVKTTGGVDRGTILIDNQEKGNISNGSGSVTGLSEGKYKVAVEAKDFHRWERPDVTCTAGQTNTVPVDMTRSESGPTGVGPGATPGGNGAGTGTISGGGSSKTLWKVMAYGGLAGTAVAGGFWVWGFTKATDFNANQLDVTGTNLKRSDFNDSQCDTTAGQTVRSKHGPTDTANIAFDKSCSGHTITKYAIGATIGAGIVAAVGLVMLARGDHTEQKPVSVTGRKTKKAPFAIVPIVGPDGGGATFAMEW